MLKQPLKSTRFIELPPERKAKAKIFASMNGKGGVGKTSISFRLALHLIRLGYNVLLWDADTQCNLTQRAGVPENLYQEARLKEFYRLTENPDFIEKQMNLPLIVHYPYLVRLPEADKIGKLAIMPGHEHGEIASDAADKMANHDYYLDPENKTLPAKYRQAMRNYLNYFDYVIIDTAPALEGSLMCKLALLAADEIICPVDGLEAAAGLQHLITWIHNTNSQAGLTSPPNITFTIMKYQAETKKTPGLPADSLLKSLVYRTLKEYLGPYVCDSGVKELPTLKGQAFDVLARRSKDVYTDVCEEIIDKTRESRQNFFNYWTKAKGDGLKEKLVVVEKEAKKYKPIFKEPKFVESEKNVRLDDGQRESVRYSH